MTTPNFSHGKPQILFSNLKLSAELRRIAVKGNAMVANWTDDVAYTKELDRRDKVLRDAIHAAGRVHVGQD